ncbi:hypothetical protein PV327_004952 [Microctonus hyperodae]|uniref:F-box domain-containing protein n=1 Tax=Microctonus hyperodae TaxID=165561 RepID=A0AA39KN20_MICHY|nr:hypothetical protein PV327_004952 [Microctonus hyperodae]
MNAGVEENTRLTDDFVDDSEDYLPPESKRMKLDDGCNNNLNSTLNSDSKNNGRWSRPGDTSLVEPEVMVDLGVSMLDDEESSESLRKSPSHEPTIFPNNYEHVNSDNQDRIFRGTNCDALCIERLEQESYHMENSATFKTMGSESGYGLKNEVFAEKTQNFDENDSSPMNTSDIDQFYLFRRKKKNSFSGEDKFNKLSDEMVLMIFKWLPKKCLVRSMLVCKRWCQIACDEALWTRLDVGSKVLSGGTLGHILPRGVQILRLAQAELADPIFQPNSEILCDDYMSKLQYLDLSMAVISPSGLTSLLSKCRLLKKLSLEKCVLNEKCCEAISQNSGLSVLNLAICEGIDIKGVEHLMKLTNLNALNIAWCSLNSETAALLCESMPPSVTRLNISGCRKTLTDHDVKNLVSSCPNLVELDLSDCTMLTINSAQSILNLQHLEHLSLSRCYSIPASTYVRLACMKSLMFLDVFGLMTELMLKSLQANSNGTEINKFLYSSVARPTVGVRRTSIWGLRVRD